MKSFIHLLNSPACIITFGGQVTDANNWFKKSLKASTKAEILKSNLNDLVADKDKFRLFTDYLLSGNSIQNERLIVNNFDGEPEIKIAYASVLSYEKQQIFIQFFETYLYNHPDIDRVESMLQEITKLTPYLNIKGKAILSEIINTHENILKGNELTGRLAQIRNKLGNSYPVLAKNEIDISALLILGLSTVEISTYGGYQASNVRNAIYRICKKLEVNSLEGLLNAFQLISAPVRYYSETSNFPR